MDNNTLQAIEIVVGLAFLAFLVWVNNRHKD